MNAMTWAPVWEAVLAQLVVPLVLAIVGAVGAWLITLVPGPLRAFLSSGTHQRDMGLLLGAMQRAALSGKPSDEVIAYARENLPDVIAKLAPGPDAMRTMADAMVAEAAAKLASVRGVAS